MSGLLAWAADVVGGVQDGDDEEGNLVPVIFTPEQQRYAVELDAKAASLTRSIQDLRLRIPPADISQRLPHLHAHSIASNVDLALQLNAHSTTRQQIREREVALQDENGAYEKAISNCQKGIQDKLQEADLLQKKLMEMDIIERDLRLVIERKQIEEKTWQSNESSNETRGNEDAYRDGEPLRNDLAEDLNRKRKELSSMEELVQKLEEQWKQIQHDSLKQPSPAQREKILDRQLHSLIEQLSVKQAQAEGLAGEIRTKQLEIEQVNAMKRKVENDFVEGGIARNRFARAASFGSIYTDYNLSAQSKQLNTGGRIENQGKMLLRSAFVMYILILHILVFIKISF